MRPVRLRLCVRNALSFLFLLTLHSLLQFAAVFACSHPLLNRYEILRVYIILPIDVAYTAGRTTPSFSLIKQCLDGPRYSDERCGEDAKRHLGRARDDTKGLESVD